MRKPKWQEGDCFVIPLKDGTGLLAQILKREPKAMNSVSCALFDQRVHPGGINEPQMSRLFSTILTTHDLLNSGRWKVTHSAKISVPVDKFPYEFLREKSFVGARIIGSGIIEKFANAFCGLYEWDKWADPNYLDKLLISPEVKPRNLRYVSDSSAG